MNFRGDSNSLAIDAGPAFRSGSTASTATIPSSRRAYVSVGILCFVNLINYMDRYTVAGALYRIKSYYHLDDGRAGLLQTCFILSYMVMAPVFGYLGDRYNRRLIMAGGVLFWSITTLLGSFIPPDRVGWFFVLRAMVGVGEASYSTVSTTIIADLFSDSARTKMLSLFYFAIPVGSGLGYIMGTGVTEFTGQWYWSLRITPGLGLLSVILIVTILAEPCRGEAEGSIVLKNSNVIDDIVQVIKIPSFIWVTLGFTCVTFSVGALAWWVPVFMDRAMAVSHPNQQATNNGLYFGIITCFAGIFGVLLGTGCAHWYRKYEERADPLLCAYSMLAAIPFVFLACLLSSTNYVVSYVLVFFGVTLLCVNWVLVTDIVMYVVIPNRRAIASSIQITISHALGDACSPYVVGSISDAIRNEDETSFMYFKSMEYALFLPVFVLVVGAACFFINSFYVIEDKKRCDNQIHGIVQRTGASGNIEEFCRDNPYHVDYYDNVNLIQ